MGKVSEVMMNENETWLTLRLEDIRKFGVSQQMLNEIAFLSQQLCSFRSIVTENGNGP